MKSGFSELVNKIKVLKENHGKIIIARKGLFLLLKFIIVTI